MTYATVSYAATPITSYLTNGTGFTANWVNSGTYSNIFLQVMNNGVQTVGYSNLFPSTTSQAITGLSVNTSYGVNLYAKNNSNITNIYATNTLGITYATVTGVAAGTYLANGTGFTVSWTSAATWSTVNIRGTAGTYSAISASSQAITGLSPNTSYTVNVYPVNSASVENTTVVQTITPVTYATVTGLSVGTYLTGGNGFTVSWSASGTSGTSWFQINLTGCGTFNNLTGTSQAVTGLSANTSYTVALSPLNSISAVNSSYATSAVVTYATVTGVAAGTYLTDGSGFTVSWTSSATWFRINITGTAGTFSNLSGTSQAITGLSANTSYTVNVYPLNSSSIQNTSGVQTITPVTYATVSGVNSNTFLSNGTGFTVSWNSSASWFRINIRGTAGTFSTLSGTSQAITGLSANTSYTVNVYPVNSQSVENTSGVQTITVVTYATLGSASAGSPTTSSLLLSWSGGSFTNVNIYATGGSYSNTLLYSNQTGSSVTVGSLSSNTAYTFTVVPCNSQNTANSGSQQTANASTSIQSASVPSTPVFYVNAKTNASGGGIPNPQTNGASISSWGGFTAVNTVTYNSSGGPNNYPYIYMAGGPGSTSPYMTCSVATPNATTQGKTVFTYFNNSSSGSYTRYFVAGGLDITFAGGGTVSFAFNNTFDFSNANTQVSVSTDTWITVCWRATVNGGGCIEDTWVNGSQAKTYTSSSPVVSNSFFTLARSEFGDTYNDPHWKGGIYAILVYDRALTNSEITTMDSNFRGGLL
jgi:hypothetical protein